MSAAAIPVEPRGIPPELRGHPRFLLWRYDGNHKKPVDPDGRACDPNDDRHWLGYPEALGLLTTSPTAPDGIGFALRGSGFGVADRDRCLGPDGALDPDAAGLLARCRTLIDVSPSGQGIHVWTRADWKANRRVSGWELLGDGYVTLTGKRLGTTRAIRAVPAFTDLYRAVPAKPELAIAPRDALVTDAELVLARALGNEHFRRLHAGEWRALYPSQSEADAAYCQHLARNGADAEAIVALLRASGLARPKLDRRDYCERTAALALQTTKRAWFGEGWTPPRPDPRLIAENDRRRELVSRLRVDLGLGGIADTLIALAADIASRIERGETPDADGWWQVSPERLAGDFRVLPGLPAPARSMSRKTALRHLKRAASLGVLEWATIDAPRSWTVGTGKRTAVVRCSRVRVAGHDFPSILAGFLGEPAPRHAPLCMYVVGTPRPNEERIAA
jgi:hypothetical protein